MKILDDLKPEAAYFGEQRWQARRDFDCRCGEAVRYSQAGRAMVSEFQCRGEVQGCDDARRFG